MPKVQIPKEKILQTAFNLLINEGYGAITISRLAKELNSSTQPISHTFGNMENFREEFTVYVMSKFNSRDSISGDNPFKIFSSVGVRYLKAAFEEPNLIYFIRQNSRKFVAHGGIGTVFDKSKNRELAKMLSSYFDISEEKAELFMQTALTYTQGLVAMIVDGTISISFEEGVHRLEEIGIIFLVYAGIPEDKAAKLCQII